MKTRALTLIAGLAALTLLLVPSLSAARDCTTGNKCADISIFGHAEPQPIRKGQTSTVKLTVKNNGPVEAYGTWVQTNIPKGLKVKRKRIYGDGGDYGCEGNKYGFVKCYPGDLSQHEESVVKIKVKGVKKNKSGYVFSAEAYADGSTNDPTGGNNQVGITIGVGGRR
jgi:hypothetical protein